LTVGVVAPRVGVFRFVQPQRPNPVLSLVDDKMVGRTYYNIAATYDGGVAAGFS